MDRLNILLFNPPFKDFAAYDLYFKPYGLLNISTFFKLLGYNPILIDCIDKNNPEFIYKVGYKKGNIKKDGTGKFPKIEVKKPEILKSVKRKYFLYGISIDFVKKYLNKFDKFDLIFINISFTYHYNILEEVIPVLRKHSPESFIILGGIYPAVYYSHASWYAKKIGIDFIVKGGFENIIEILLKMGEKISNHKKIIDRKYLILKNRIINFIKSINKNIKHNDSFFINSLFELTFVEKYSNYTQQKYSFNIKDFFNIKESYKYLMYLENFFSPDWNQYKELDYGIIRTEKGCPYSCPYCSSKVIYPDYSEKSIDLILGELFYFKKRGIRNIAFYDDALLVNKKRVKLLLKKIYNKFNDYFYFYLPNAVHLRFLDEEILYYFKILNFKMIRFGFETAEDYWIEHRGGKFNKKELEYLFVLLENSGIEKKFFKFYILIGLPDQTEEEVRYSVNYLLKKGYKPYFALYSPIPSTTYFNLLVNSLNNEFTLFNKNIRNIVNKTNEAINGKFYNDENNVNLYKNMIKYDIREPLLQNPSIYTYNNTVFTEDKVKKWKLKIKLDQLL